MTDSCVQHSNMSHHKRTKFFLFNSSVNTCRTRIKETFSRFTRAKVEHDLREDPISLSQLDDILNPSMSKGMMELPRIDPENRLPNDNFQILTWRKLQVRLFPREGVKLCPCGAIVDKHWDHCGWRASQRSLQGLRQGSWGRARMRGNFEWRHTVRVCASASGE